MLVEVHFKDGYITTLNHLHIRDGFHYYSSEDAYLIVPWSDVVLGRVPSTQSKPTEIAKSDNKWKEVKLSSDSDTE